MTDIFDKGIGGGVRPSPSPTLTPVPVLKTSTRTIVIDENDWSFSLLNAGAADLIVSSIKITGFLAQHVVIYPPTSFTIARDKTHSTKLQYHPRKGLHGTGWIEIESNAYQAPKAFIKLVKLREDPPREPHHETGEEDPTPGDNSPGEIGWDDPRLNMDDGGDSP